MITKCLFPAAGFGTRFLPATKAVPKEMLPILNKPLLQYGVEEALDAGIHNMAIVTGKGKRAIEDHFDNGFELEKQLRESNKEHYLQKINQIIQNSTFTYVRQKRMLGLGDAILSGRALIGNQSFAVILADDFCHGYESGVISQLIEVYKKYKCSIIAIEEIPLNQTSNYGIIDGDLIGNNSNIYQVTQMIEKPDEKKAPTNLAIIGRYILTPDIFDVIKNTQPDKNGEIQLTDALNIQAQQGRVIALKFKGARFDCGSVMGYLKATNYLARIKGFEG